LLQRLSKESKIGFNNFGTSLRILKESIKAPQKFFEVLQDNFEAPQDSFEVFLEFLEDLQNSCSCSCRGTNLKKYTIYLKNLSPFLLVHQNKSLWFLGFRV
jgi:hypothetical protein